MLEILNFGPLAPIWEIVSGVQDPVGRLVNTVILVLFALAVADLGVATLRVVFNDLLLRRARRRLSRMAPDDPGPTELVEWLRRLGLNGIGRWSLVAHRVRDLVQLRSRRTVDSALLKEITGDRMSLLGGFARFVAGTLTVIGLVGTVLGLTVAMSQLPELAATVKESEEIGPFLDHVLHTLGGMKTAFSCTLAGLVSSVILSVLNFGVQRLQGGFYVRLESVSHAYLVPRIVPASADNATNEFVDHLQASGTTIREILDRVSTASDQFCEGAEAVKRTADEVAVAGGAMRDDSTRLLEAANQIQAAGETFRDAAGKVAGQHEQQSQHWAGVASDLKTTADSLAGQVQQLTSAVAALHASSAALGSINSFPDALQNALTKAVEAAIESSRLQQEAATGELLGRFEQFQASYADLVAGVQHTVAELLERTATGVQQTVLGNGARHDEILAELRTMNGHLGNGKGASPSPSRFSFRSPAAQPPASERSDGYTGAMSPGAPTAVGPTFDGPGGPAPVVGDGGRARAVPPSPRKPYGPAPARPAPESRGFIGRMFGR